jgi:hypothetical protein
MTAAEKADCRLQGGNVIVAGMFANEICVMPYADGGKVCRKSGDCLAGWCEVEGPESKAGTCPRDDNPFGCRSYFTEDGEIGSECQD